jgi:small conductance mechanosensitive channel
MLDRLSKFVPAQLTEYIPEALDNLDIAPASLSKGDPWDKFLNSLPNLVIIILIAAVFLWTTKRIIRFVARFKSRRRKNAEDVRRIQTVAQVLTYALTVLVYLATTLLLLEKLHIAVTPVLGAAGIFGIAIGFGAQSLVKDYFNGLFLLIENQIRQGDSIEIANKSGTVEDVTLRYVALRDYEGNVHFVPNSLITAVTNKSRGYGYAVMDVNVADLEDPDRCMEVMKKVGAEMRSEARFTGKIIADLDIAGIHQWTDSTLTLRCRFKVDPMEKGTVRREYLRRLRLAFEQEGILLPAKAKAE